VTSVKGFRYNGNVFDRNVFGSQRVQTALQLAKISLAIAEKIRDLARRMNARIGPAGAGNPEGRSKINRNRALKDALDGFAVPLYLPTVIPGPDVLNRELEVHIDTNWG
jgi:hypothetical protein